MSRVRPLRALLVLALVGVAACDDGGPGAWTATVEGPSAVGAVLVEVRGEGITGFEGVGDARVFPGPVVEGAAGRRILVVGAGGTTSFHIRVDDVSRTPPSVTLVSAVDDGNLPLLALAEYQVRVAR